MAVQNSLAEKKKADLATCSFNVFMTSDAVKNKINKMVGGKDGQRFITSIISAISTNPGLSECENMSILSAAMLGESLKLSPSPQLGQYYMVPFKDKKRNCKVAQFQLGYKGYIQLAIRSGYYTKLNVLAIKEGELISYNPLDEDIKVNLIEDDYERESTATIGYYAMFEYSNGFKKSMYWSKRKMLVHADKYSQAFSSDGYSYTNKNTGEEVTKVSFADFEAGKFNKSDEWLYSSFWYKDFDGMAYKTMLRQLISKWGVMSIEMQNAFVSDMGVIDDSGNPQYVDNVELDAELPEQEQSEPPKTVDVTAEYIKEDLDEPNEDKTTNADPFAQ